MTCPTCRVSLPDPRLLVLPCKGKDDAEYGQKYASPLFLQCSRAVTTKQAVEPCGQPGRVVRQTQRLAWLGLDEERVRDVVRCEGHG